MVASLEIAEGRFPPLTDSYPVYHNQRALTSSGYISLILFGVKITPVGYVFWKPLYSSLFIVILNLAHTIISYQHTGFHAPYIEC